MINRQNEDAQSADQWRPSPAISQLLEFSGVRNCYAKHIGVFHLGNGEKLTERLTRNGYSAELLLRSSGPFLHSILRVGPD